MKPSDRLQISCYKKIKDERVEGILSILPDRLHFEANFPKNSRLVIALHSILGQKIQEDGSLLFLSTIGIVVFHGDIDHITMIHEVVTENRRNLSPAKMVDPVVRNILYTIESVTYHGETKEFVPCSISILPNSIEVIPRHHEVYSIPFSDIVDVTHNGWQLQIHSKAQPHPYVYKGTQIQIVHAVIQTFQKNTEKLEQVWLDSRQLFSFSSLFSIEVIVLRSASYISYIPYYRISYLLFASIHIAITTITSIHFQASFFAIHTTDTTQYNLVGQHSKNFYKRVSEHITPKDSTFFLGMSHEYRRENSSILSYIQELSLLPTQEYCITRVSLWTDTRIVYFGSLLIYENTLCFICDGQQTPYFQYKKNDLSIHEEQHENILTLQFESQQLCFMFSRNETKHKLMEYLNLPNQHVTWNNLSHDVQKELVDGHLVLLDENTAQLSLQSTGIEAILLHKKDTIIPTKQRIHVIKKQGDNQHASVQFTTTVQSHTANGYLLHYPTQLQIWSNRRYYRLQTNFPISVLALVQDPHNKDWLPTDTIYPATLLDISIQGCGISIESDLAHSITQTYLLIEFPIQPTMHLLATVVHRSTTTHDSDIHTQHTRFGLLFQTDTHNSTKQVLDFFEYQISNINNDNVLSLTGRR